MSAMLSVVLISFCILFSLISLCGDVLLYENIICSVFRRVQPLEKQLPCYIFNGLTYGALQEKLLTGADDCKGLEDVVGSVRGFLQANK